MTVREKAFVFWGVVGILLIAGLIWLRPILLPFVAGAAIAYFLNPIADRLSNLGMSRFLATLLILFVFLTDYHFVFNYRVAVFSA